MSYGLKWWWEQAGSKDWHLVRQHGGVPAAIVTGPAEARVAYVGGRRVGGVGTLDEAMAWAGAALGEKAV